MSYVLVLISYGACTQTLCTYLSRDCIFELSYTVVTDHNEHSCRVDLLPFSLTNLVLRMTSRRKLRRERKARKEAKEKR